MKLEVREVYSDEIVKRALEQFSLEGKTKDLNGFENYVYEVFKGEEPFILRITHSSHRSQGEILAEMDWMNFLNGEGVNVPRAFPSKEGELVVPLEARDGTYFYACLFSKAKGNSVKITDDEVFNEKLFYAYGQTIGKMHRATRKYKEHLETRRKQWDEDDLIVNFAQYLSQNEQKIYENGLKLYETVRQLPKSNENFGLIHTDLHSGNFFYDGEEIHTFDFDDSAYMWLASDIAIPLYYSTLWRYPNGDKTERQQFADTFLRVFIEGYQSVMTPPPLWKEHLPLFLRLRDLTLYVVFNKQIPEEERSERVRQLIKEIGERIENNEPIVEIR